MTNAERIAAVLSDALRDEGRDFLAHVITRLVSGRYGIAVQGSVDTRRALGFLMDEGDDATRMAEARADFIRP